MVKLFPFLLFRSVFGYLMNRLILSHVRTPRCTTLNINFVEIGGVAASFTRACEMHSFLKKIKNTIYFCKQCQNDWTFFLLHYTAFKRLPMWTIFWICIKHCLWTIVWGYFRKIKCMCHQQLIQQHPYNY